MMRSVLFRTTGDVGIPAEYHQLLTRNSFVSFTASFSVISRYYFGIVVLYVIKTGHSFVGKSQ